MNKEKATIVSLFDYIESRELIPGSQLPSTPTQIKELKVSANTVRRALQRLADHEVIATHQGKGTFLKKPLTKLLKREILDSFDSSEFKIGRRVSVEKTFKLMFLSAYSTSHDIYKSINSGIEEVISQLGHSFYAEESRLLKIESSVSCKDFNEVLEGFDGAVLWVIGWNNEKMEELSKVDFPYVVIDFDRLHNNGISIGLEEGCEKAVQIFAEKGKKKIAVFEPHILSALGTYERILESSVNNLKNLYPEIDIQYFSGPDYLIDFFNSPDSRKTEAIYYNDDVFCCRDSMKFARENMIPGLNLDIITQASRDTCDMVPEGIGKIVFDMSEVGRHAVHMLDRILKIKPEYPQSPVKVCGVYEE